MYTYLCLGDSDDEYLEDCFPTFNQLMRQGKSDTDSDMPHLTKPEEIQSHIDEHEAEQKIGNI